MLRLFKHLSIVLSLFINLILKYLSKRPLILIAIFLEEHLVLSTRRGHHSFAYHHHLVLVAIVCKPNHLSGHLAFWQLQVIVAFANPQLLAFCDKLLCLLLLLHSGRYEGSVSDHWGLWGGRRGQEERVIRWT